MIGKTAALVLVSHRARPNWDFLAFFGAPSSARIGPTGQLLSASGWFCADEASARIAGWRKVRREQVTLSLGRRALRHFEPRRARRDRREDPLGARLHAPGRAR